MRIRVVRPTRRAARIVKPPAGASWERGNAPDRNREPGRGAVHRPVRSRHAAHVPHRGRADPGVPERARRSAESHHRPVRVGMGGQHVRRLAGGAAAPHGARRRNAAAGELQPALSGIARKAPARGAVSVRGGDPPAGGAPRRMCGVGSSDATIGRAHDRGPPVALRGWTRERAHVRADRSGAAGATQEAVSRAGRAPSAAHASPPPLCVRAYRGETAT